MALGCFSNAHADLLPEGEFITEGGRGWLSIGKLLKGDDLDDEVINQDPENSQLFSIRYFGANGHSCTLDGLIESGLYIDQRSHCAIQFHLLESGGIKVDLANECLPNYCGARANLADVYLKPALGCSISEVLYVESNVEKLTRAEDYQAAKVLLEPVLQNCSQSLSWYQKNRLRNDLAELLLKLEDKKHCISVLEPFMLDLQKDITNQNLVCENLPYVECLEYQHELQRAKIISEACLR